MPPISGASGHAQSGKHANRCQGVKKSIAPAARNVIVPNKKAAEIPTTPKIVVVNCHLLKQAAFRRTVEPMHGKTRIIRIGTQQSVYRTGPLAVRKNMPWSGGACSAPPGISQRRRGPPSRRRSQPDRICRNGKRRSFCRCEAGSPDRTPDTAHPCKRAAREIANSRRRFSQLPPGRELLGGDMLSASLCRFAGLFDFRCWSRRFAGETARSLNPFRIFLIASCGIRL